MSDLVSELRKGAKAIYIAVESPVAEDISERLFIPAAHEIERLREVAKHAQALLDGGGDEAVHHLRKALAALEESKR